MRSGLNHLQHGREFRGKDQGSIEVGKLRILRCFQELTKSRARSYSRPRSFTLSNGKVVYRGETCRVSGHPIAVSDMSMEVMMMGCHGGHLIYQSWRRLYPLQIPPGSQTLPAHTSHFRTALIPEHPGSGRALPTVTRGQSSDLHRGPLPCLSPTPPASVP